MDLDDAEEQATALLGRGTPWGPFQIACGTGLVLYLAWAGSLALGLRKLSPVQVPFVPSSAVQVRNMMSLLEGRFGKLVDLGSGDGRVVLEAYKQGFRPAIGYELNPWLLQLSNCRAWWAGCYGKVSYLREDLLKADLSNCNNVTVFLAPSMVPLLEKKLLSELPDEACVVAARFPFLGWTPTRVAGDNLERVWAYNIRDVRRAGQSTSGKNPVKEGVTSSAF